MGVVVRQSIKGSIVNYVGLAVSIFSVLFVYPKDLELYGLYNFIIGIAILLTPFTSLGAGSIAVRYFPVFQNQERGHGGLLSLALILCLLGNLIFIVLFFIFQPWLISYYEAKQQGVESYLIYIVPLTLLLSLSAILSNYCLNFHRVAFPLAVSNLLKIVLPVFFLLVLNKWIDVHGFFYLLVGFSLVQFCIILWYVKKMGHLFWRHKITIPEGHRFRQILQYSVFVIFGSLGALFALQIDTLMVTNFLGTQATGKYSLGVFMAASCYVPGAMILNAMLPNISKNLAENNLHELEKNYKKSSIAILLPTLFLASGLFVCFLPLRELMVNSEKLNGVASVLTFLIMARVVDGATSINGTIIGFSKYYRFDFIFLLLLGTINIGLNYYLIPRYGITGAAFSTFLSTTIYNVTKSVFIYLKFGLHPFSRKIITIFLIAGLTSVLGFAIPPTGYPLLDLLVKGTFVAIGFVFLAYKAHISMEFNQLFEKYVLAYIPGRIQ